MSWWCSAEGKVWTWEWSPYLGAWLLTAVLVGLLVMGYRRDREFPLRRKVAAFLGVALLLVATDWPMAAMGAGYLLSVQMARQVIVVLIAVPLLMYGAPPVVGRWLQRGRRPELLRVVGNPLVAVVVANAILITINTPVVSDRMIGSPIGSFVLDIFWLVAGFVLWFPVQPPAPMTPRLAGPLALVYLIIQSVAPLPTAFFMTWAEYPLFATFELSPRIFESFGPVDDQQMGAAVMQVIGGFVIWAQIAARFLNWSLEKQRGDAGEPTYVLDPDDLPKADPVPSVT